MYLTHTIRIKMAHKHYKMLDNYAFLCKNLFNVATYHNRQAVITNNKTPTAFNLINQLTKTKQQDYKAIPAKVAQQVIKQVYQNFRSFWAVIKAYHKDKSKFLGRPKLPKYLDKTKGRANIIFTKQAISKRDLQKGILTLSSYFDTPLSFDLGKLKTIVTYDNLQEVRVVKIANGYDIKITYKTDEPILKPNNGRYLAVDLGLNNLLTVVSNTNDTPFIMTGKTVKSTNQFFNKIKAKLTSSKDKLKNKAVAQKHFINKKLSQLSAKRNNQINDYLHKASYYLINHAVADKITTIVIGHNQDWKQGINIGKKNNQNFVSVPFARLVQLIQYKAKLQGIDVIVTEESYTSKCSFLDNEPIQKNANYQGKRIKRGLFKSSNNTLINADVNGAYNILRKVIGKFDYDPIVVCSTPKMINPLKANP
ncbi:RNA-guided endonuclease InsQ/TnpB family protein [Faucicola mancuniensis]|uniref:RNA-guided endonuclease InsQ/TnpB family protein n=1 Tax=Faucicola mancuniensis TaxID=1309795 RepID=UPI003977532A